MPVRFAGIAVFYTFFAMSVLVSSATSQSDVGKVADKTACYYAPEGFYVQITNAKVLLAGEYTNGLFIMKDSDIKAGRWTLDPRDEIDPTYKFLISRPNRSAGNMGGKIVEIEGKLSAPTGKLFDLTRASFDCDARTLSFKTVDRDGLAFEGEIRFYPKPFFKEQKYYAMSVFLVAQGKSLGKVTMEFPIESVSYE